MNALVLRAQGEPLGGRGAMGGGATLTFVLERALVLKTAPSAEWVSFVEAFSAESQLGAVGYFQSSQPSWGQH